MLYDFQEQNSLQLAEGLAFDRFLWLFYNCLQIFSSFTLFWKVLGGSQKLFCVSMCLLARIQEPLQIKGTITNACIYTIVVYVML